MNRVLKISLWTLGIGIIVICGFLFIPVFMSAKYAARTVVPLQQLKVLQASVQIYIADHDERFPAATSMPSLRALLGSPNGDSKYWRASHNYTEPRFNFNLAGVSLSEYDTPLGYPGYDHSPRPTLLYIYDIERSQYNACSYMDMPRRFVISSNEPLEPKNDFFKSVSYQFDRKGAKLFPLDYVADKDPLKETK